MSDGDVEDDGGSLSLTYNGDYGKDSISGHQEFVGESFCDSGPLEVM